MTRSRAATRSRGDPGAGATASVTRRALALLARPAAALAMAALLAGAANLPLWTARLVAPQYPKGLWLQAYGHGLEGDIAEINTLNHYIGMRPLDAAAIPELQLFGLALGAIAVLALAGLVANGIIGRLATAALWSAPVVALADIQRWLIHFGQDLDPEAALRVKPFIPLAVGPTSVWNFQIIAYPGPALGALVLIALVVTLARRAPTYRGRRRAPLAAAAALVLAACSTQPAAHDHGVVPPALHGTSHGAHGANAPWLDAAPVSAATFDLRAAIATVAPGSEIRVPAGTYRGVFVVDRTVTLVADGHVVLDGGGRGTVLTLAAPGASVRGIHVRGSGGQVEDAAAIAVLADRTSIEHALITDSYTGILVRAASGVRLVGNRIVGPGGLSGSGSLDVAHAHAPTGTVGDGISLWDARDVLVRGNEIDGVRDGVYLSYSGEVLVDTNTVTASRYALHSMFGEDLMIFGNRLRRNASGLVLMYTRSVEASRNLVEEQRGAATGYGILLKDVAGVRLVENVLRGNAIGLKAEGVEEGATGAKALRNEISYNIVGAQLFPTAAMALAQNGFIDNLVPVEIPGTRSRIEWMDHGVGNYWSAHRGYDLNGDGRSDVAHTQGATASPAMRGLQGTLAARILERAQRAWALDTAPLVLDRSPLVAPVLQAAPSTSRDAGDSLAWLLTGSIALGLPGVGLYAARPRP